MQNLAISDKRLCSDALATIIIIVRAIVIVIIFFYPIGLVLRRRRTVAIPTAAVYRRLLSFVVRACKIKTHTLKTPFPPPEYCANARRDVKTHIMQFRSSRRYIAAAAAAAAARREHTKRIRHGSSSKARTYLLWRITFYDARLCIMITKFYCPGR